MTLFADDDPRPNSPAKAAHNLSLFVLVMAAVNTSLIALFALISQESSEGLDRTKALLAVLGALAGGILVSWGIGARWRWAWIAAVLAFGSILLFGLITTGMALVYGEVDASILLLVVGLVLGVWPLSFAVKARPLFFPQTEDEED